MAQPFRDGGAITAQPFRDVGDYNTVHPFRDWGLSLHSHSEMGGYYCTAIQRWGAITVQPFRDGGLSLHSHAEMNTLTPTRLKLQTYLCKIEWVHVDFLLECV